ncbi:hypothetical protein D9619_004426 [Psilocybe cf. subviscida]|uniref:Uncharacterized protein n=1 Tax=Psilocybe cf. subviscida TaxID=2480587 RepID=A0A8H5BR23_9AGAR|nr:hypothetical protein D9619_004426 [Psilocybe cf. subviscida]
MALTSSRIGTLVELDTSPLLKTISPPPPPSSSNPPTYRFISSPPMALLSYIVGYSMVGFAARVGQLGIQGRNLASNPGGHLLSMGAFGALGYGAYHWEIKSSELLAQKRQEIEERRVAAMQARAGAEE